MKAYQPTKETELGHSYVLRKNHLASGAALSGLALLVTVAAAETVSAAPRDNDSKYSLLGAAGATYLKASCFDIGLNFDFYFSPNCVMARVNRERQGVLNKEFQEALENKILSRAYINSLGGNVPPVVYDAGHRSDDAAAHSVGNVVADVARTAERYGARAMENQLVRTGVQAVEIAGGKNATRKAANNIDHWFLGILGAGGLGALWRKMRS